MKGKVKFFDRRKGWGFIADAETNKETFFHKSNIKMSGRRTLFEGDIVEYEIGEGSTGRNQAVNVTPIITLSMVAHELSKEKLHTERIRDDKGWHGWKILDKDGNVVVDKEMSLIDLAAYVGFVDGLVKGGFRNMDLTELLGALAAHNQTNKGYQVQLNSGNLDKKSNKHTDVEFGDLYFTNCKILNKSILCFDNVNRKPIDQKEDGTNLYPMEINSHMFLEMTKIEHVEDVKDFEDWFQLPSERVINLYMYPQNDNVDGSRNVVTIGFMD